MLRMVGNAYGKTGAPWLAVANLSQALRYAPEYEHESGRLAKLLDQLGEPAWANHVRDHWALENAVRGGKTP
jgi:hypothetical protein